MSRRNLRSREERMDPWPISVWQLPLELPQRSEIVLLARELEPQATVRIGMIGNRGSRQNLRSRFSLLGHILPEADLLWQTRNPRNLVDALVSLLFRARVNVLAVAGGDGTLHHVVNLLVRISDEIYSRDGERPRLPPLLVMPGGTMNIFARAFGTKDLPLRAAARFRELFAHKPIAKLSTRKVGLLHVETQKRGKLVGFVLGSGLMVDALRVYENLGAGYLGLGRFLGHAASGAILSTKTWKENVHRLQRGHTKLEINSDQERRARAVVCSTIPLSLLRGVVKGLGKPGVALAAGRFMTLAAGDLDDRELVTAIPSILSQSPHSGIIRENKTQTLRFQGPITLDGEIFANEESFQYFEDDEVQVRRLDFDLDIVRPDWTSLIV